MPLLDVKGLKTYFYADDTVIKAVDGITYDVEAGETVALVGESGCGKSVSSLSILQLIPSPPGRIVGGEVNFDGDDLLQLSAVEMRRVRSRRIAMIFQEPTSSLNPVINIGTQLTEGMVSQLNLTKAQANTRALELLEIVGISNPEGRLRQFPHEFSGGMRQRVMIAIALSCEAQLIIADEPTTALDVTIQAQILDLMRDLTRDRGMALLLITHNLGVVARYASRINIMYAGRIVERGSALDIFEQPSHPYTIGLLNSIPRLDREKAYRLEPIPGQPPDLAQLPIGCHFSPRCRYAIEKCSEEYPESLEVNDSHESACWVAEQLTDASSAMAAQP